MQVRLYWEPKPYLDAYKRVILNEALLSFGGNKVLH